VFAHRNTPNAVIGVSCYNDIDLTQNAYNQGLNHVAFSAFFHQPPIILYSVPNATNAQTKSTLSVSDGQTRCKTLTYDAKLTTTPLPHRRSANPQGDISVFIFKGTTRRWIAETSSWQSSDIVSEQGHFIYGWADWNTADSSGALRIAAWADGGKNDICPAGFSVPTEAELKKELKKANSAVYSVSDAASSFLRIPAAGFRDSSASSAFKNKDADVALWVRNTRPFHKLVH
jgi:hypothetical protein